MTLKVDIHKLDEQAYDVKVGTLTFDGRQILRSNDDHLLRKVATRPIHNLKGEIIDPVENPERFMHYLHEEFRGPYLRASQAEE